MSYKQTVFSLPGVEALAYVPSTSLPLYNAIGTGYSNCRQLEVEQPQTLYQLPAVPDIGLTGTQAGQIALMPLLDTRGIF